MATPQVFRTSPETPQEEQAASDGASSIANEEKNNYVIPEDPFDTEYSRILFDALDQLQSNGTSQHIPIPQLVIVGEQSTGKSALLQSLTDIPFPVGSGLCTRFATRIVSKRTGPNTSNQFKVTIVEPEVTIKGLSYAEDDAYKEYVRIGDSLTPEEFGSIMDEVYDLAADYMGIKPGKGDDKKNFATQVLRIELSGPGRSQFSIVDIPGIFRSHHNVNAPEMAGIKEMVLQYMKNEGNIVICILDASIDLTRQDLPSIALKNVSKDRIVGVFTKCDKADNADEICSIVSSGESHELSTGHGWFVVRNRFNNEDKSFDLAHAEEELFSKPPWNHIPHTQRGSNMLKKYLSNLLCANMRNNFPAIQATIQQNLFDARSALQSLGKPRHTHHDRVQYLNDVVQRYETIAVSAMEKPGQVREEMRIRQKVKDENDIFSKLMREKGHKFQFEDPEMDAAETLYTSGDDPFTVSVHTPERGLGGKSIPTFSYPVTPPSSNDSPVIGIKRQPPPRQQFNQKSTTSNAACALFEDIRLQIRTCQTTQLPGLINPDVMPTLFQTQTEKWQGYVEQHLETVSTAVGDISSMILNDVCPRTSRSVVLHDTLRNHLSMSWEGAKGKTKVELNTFCHRERSHMLSTTDPRFLDELKTLQTIRLIQSLRSLPQSTNVSTIYDQLHFSIEDNMVRTVHDILKVYYQVRIRISTNAETRILTLGTHRLP
ncbi:hypothetical protein TruAng_005880 [Truncatella angustata]|nr:hypothetical protein TruAng_005880 [Truncatella angustata]